MTINFVLNGTPQSLDISAETPLLFVLRDSLQINSPRLGCGQEQCGACCILIDGATAFSCTKPIQEVAGKSVTTVEGLLTEDGKPGVLQQAFIDENAGQCGYCLSGILMTASELLAGNPAPSRREIQTALEPHLCRCGAHNRIIRAISRAAKIQGTRHD